MRLRSSSFLLLLVSLMLIIGLGASVVAANEYPSEPIRLISWPAPGGGTDLMARSFASVASDYFGVPVYVTHITGGAGIPGTLEAAQSPPDGYTGMILLQGPQLLQPHLMGKDAVPLTIDSFEYIGQFNDAPLGITVRADAPYDTLEEFIAYVREADRFFYAHSPNIPHIAAEAFAIAADIEMLAISHPGGAPAIADLLGGHVGMVPQPIDDLLDYIEEGDLKVLAVFSQERMEQLPEVPTAIEYGYDLEFGVWRGIALPQGTPPEIVEVWRENMKKICEDPSFIGLMRAQGAPIVYRSGEDLRKRMERDYMLFGELIEKMGLAH